MIRVLIADDHPIVLEGIRRLLEMEADIHIVAEARDGVEAVDLCQSLKPDVAIVDFAMPRLDGMETTQRLAGVCPRTRVIILTMHDSEQQAARLLQAGAAGFIPKGASADEVANAIRKVHAGGAYISPKVLEKIGRHIRDVTATNPLLSLSEREVQVLKAIVEGKKTARIAADLHLSTSTVHSYRYRMMKKLDVQGNSGLVRFALANKLVK